MIKGILFDLDNTLYDYDYSHNIALQKVFKSINGLFGIPFDEINNLYEIAKKEVKKNIPNTASSHNRILYFQKLLEIIKKNPLEYALEFYEIYWETFINNMALEKDSLEILELLHSKYKMCLITDMVAAIQYKKIKKLSLSKYFNHIVVSEEIGTEKPDKKNFFECMKKMKLRANELIMIGDDYKKDIKGAISLGIKAFWYDRYNKKIDLDKKVSRFKNYAELKELLFENGIGID